MKTLLQILSALWHGFVGGAGDTRRTCDCPLILFLMFRIGLAIFLLPMVVISALLTDSGKDEGLALAIYTMSSMSLLVFGALLWSWRCVAASVCCLITYFFLWALLGVFAEITGARANYSILSQIWWVFFLFWTERWAAPMRKTYFFVMWCLEDDDNNGPSVNNSITYIPLKEIV